MLVTQVMNCCSIKSYIVFALGFYRSQNSMHVYKKARGLTLYNIIIPSANLPSRPIIKVGEANWRRERKNAMLDMALVLFGTHRHAECERETETLCFRCLSNVIRSGGICQWSPSLYGVSTKLRLIDDGLCRGRPGAIAESSVGRLASLTELLR
jgi:hypothetical protein